MPAATPETALLEVNGLCAGYGPIRIIEDISFTVRAGDRLAVLGRNGMGKTTLLATLMGLSTRHAGQIKIGDHDVSRRRTSARADLGIGYVPQTRDIFASLTVEENLRSGLKGRPSSALAEAYEMFPRLRERRRNYGMQLSGGEQQMLSMARALAVNPSILLVDELSMGLAPKIVEELYEVLGGIARQGLTILVVEQFAAEVLKVADSGALLINGRITYHGAPGVVGDMISSAYLGGDHAAPAAAKDRVLEGQ
jgi:branched-chain amino acid transport system ATP-binding protein